MIKYLIKKLDENPPGKKDIILATIILFLLIPFAILGIVTKFYFLWINLVLTFLSPAFFCLGLPIFMRWMYHRIKREKAKEPNEASSWLIVVLTFILFLILFLSAVVFWITVVYGLFFRTR
jgi:cell division protein FtsW (lipid II flippase)